MVGPLQRIITKIKPLPSFFPEGVTNDLYAAEIKTVKGSWRVNAWSREHGKTKIYSKDFKAKTAALAKFNQIMSKSVWQSD